VWKVRVGLLLWRFHASPNTWRWVKILADCGCTFSGGFEFYDSSMVRAVCNSWLTLTANHPRVDIRCAEAPQFSDPRSAYLALASEALKCFRMDLQQSCRLARIEESLELRERLAAWCCFMHLAHKTPYSTFKYVSGIQGNGSLIRSEICPSMCMSG
jgi:hypothetical protein